MNTDNLPAAPSYSPPAVVSELSIEELSARVGKVRAAIRDVMTDQDLITVPGVAKKVAGKSFAEKLGLLFMFSPRFTSRIENDGEHREVFVTCALTHTPTGREVATCDASCSTRESKYRWRNADRTCPSCGKATIIKGKSEYGGGFICFAKKGGCGAKFREDDTAILAQPTGRVENPDIADVYNTVGKMAQKRAYVGAMLLAAGASDIVTQDLEDAGPFESAPPVADMMPRETQAPTPQPAAQASPHADTSGMPLVKIVGVEVATGQKAKGSGQWTRYGVSIDFGDGQPMVAGTFSKTIGTAAQAAVGKSARVDVRAVQKGDKTYQELAAIVREDGTPWN